MPKEKVSPSIVWFQIPEPLDVTDFAGPKPEDPQNPNADRRQFLTLYELYRDYGVKHMPLAPDSVDDNDRVWRMYERLKQESGTWVDSSLTDVTTTFNAIRAGLQAKVGNGEAFVFMLRLLRPLQATQSGPPKSPEPEPAAAAKAPPEPEPTAEEKQPPKAENG